MRSCPLLPFCLLLVQPADAAADQRACHKHTERRLPQQRPQGIPAASSGCRPSGTRCLRHITHCLCAETSQPAFACAEALPA
jgi:hypothetical protein